jgi:hypothetical protein
VYLVSKVGPENFIQYSLDNLSRGVRSPRDGLSALVLTTRVSGGPDLL